MLTIKTMEEPYQEDHIVGLLRNQDDSIDIQKIERIYYPYVKLMYSFVLKGKLSKLNKQMMCNVDLVYGRHAIGQGKPAFVPLEVEDHMVLPISISEEEYLKTSRDYVFKIFLGKMKILQTPEIQLADIEHFYKLFYIVHCKDSEEADYYLLVDSMDGNIVVLDC